MKTKFSRILGIALTLAMVASLFVFAIPVAAQPGNMTWAAQTIPTATGNVILNTSDVGDIAISGDGTIYVINNDDGINANTAGSVLRSTDGGQSFTALANVGGVALRFMRAIAVAPDDSTVVMVTDGFDCYLTTDSGSTWTTLGTDAVAGPGAIATNEILDVDVSPAIPGALFGRHYARAVADGAITVTASQAQLMGVQQTDWTSVAPVGGTNGDYLAVKFSPNYMGDRALAVLYNTATDTFFDIISQPEAAGQTLTQTCDITPITSLDYMRPDGVVAVVAGSVLVGDIALPSDWDPTLTAGQVSYVSVGTETAGGVGAGTANRGALVGITTGTASDDVYRIDANASVALGGVTSLPIHSIAYEGTISDGTLFLGERASTNVKWTLNPTSSAPTWTSTSKAPTGDDTALTPENCTVVRVAPNGDIYAGTSDIWQTGGSDQRSAFSVSTDSGVTFNQTALIDVGAANVGNIDDFMLTPDGGTMFMSTRDAKVDLSLWKSSTPTGSDTWERVYLRTAAGPSIVRLAPDYADNPSIFWANTAAANLWVSHDGGAIFANRTPTATIVDLVAESGGSTGVLYMSNAGDIYKSTNGGYFFGLAEPSLVAAATSLSMAPAYPAMPEAGNLLVGGNAEVSYSTNSAASFTLIDSGLGTAGNTVVGADEDYATSNTIYAAGGGDGTVYRFVIGTDTSWTDLVVNEGLNAGVASTGLALSNGTLYVADLTAGRGVYRTLGPLDPAGTLVWERMDTGPGAVATFTLGAQNVAGHPSSLRVANNVVFAIDTSVGAPFRLLAFDDFLATAAPVLTGPADGFAVGVDPVGGRADIVTLSFAAMGAGSSLVTDYDIDITEATDTAWSARTRTNVVVGNPSSPQTDVVAGAAAPNVNVTLRANKSYIWRIRAEDTVSNENLQGQWSEIRILNVEAGGAVVETQYGPLLQGPVGGATNVSLNPGFSWAPIFGATEYEFILATDATLTNTVEDTPVLVTQPSWQVPAGTLEYDTQYFWAVKATQPTESPQSIGTFRTMISELYACPFCSETFTTAGALESHISAMHPAATPAYIWAIIVIGAVLMIAVIMLIVKTRRVA